MSSIDFIIVTVTHFTTNSTVNKKLHVILGSFIRPFCNVVKVVRNYESVGMPVSKQCPVFVCTE